MYSDPNIHLLHYLYWKRNNGGGSRTSVPLLTITLGKSQGFYANNGTDVQYIVKNEENESNNGLNVRTSFSTLRFC